MVSHVRCDDKTRYFRAKFQKFRGGGFFFFGKFIKRLMVFRGHMRLGNSTLSRFRDDKISSHLSRVQTLSMTRKKKKNICKVYGQSQHRKNKSRPGHRIPNTPKFRNLFFLIFFLENPIDDFRTYSSSSTEDRY